MAFLKSFYQGNIMKKIMLSKFVTIFLIYSFDSTFSMQPRPPLFGRRENDINKQSPSYTPPSGRRHFTPSAYDQQSPLSKGSLPDLGIKCFPETCGLIYPWEKSQERPEGIRTYPEAAAVSLRNPFCTKQISACVVVDLNNYFVNTLKHRLETLRATYGALLGGFGIQLIESCFNVTIFFNENMLILLPKGGRFRKNIMQQFKVDMGRIVAEFLHERKGEGYNFTMKFNHKSKAVRAKQPEFIIFHTLLQTVGRNLR